jgi:hypothetical protein
MKSKLVKNLRKVKEAKLAGHGADPESPSGRLLDARSATLCASDYCTTNGYAEIVDRLIWRNRRIEVME